MIFLNLFAKALVFHVLLIPVTTFFGAVVLLTLVKLKKASASLRAGISAATLIVVLILPWAAMTVPKITVPIFSSAPDAQTESLNRHLPPSGIFLPPTNLSPTPAALSEPLSSMEPSKTSPVPKPSKYAFNWHFLAGALISILILVWLLGVLWGFVVLILGMMGIIRLRWSSHLVTDNRLIEALRVSRARLNYRGSVLLLISDRIALPITWGWLQAKIALPQDVLSWPAERIDAALLHELAHIKRRDFTVQTLSRVTCSFHWYNPLVVRLFRVWKSEAEQACDDLVLRSGYSGERYSNILLEVWRSATIPRPQSSLGLAMVRTSTLEQRVIAILDPEKEREEVSPRKHMQLLVIFGSITLVVAVLGLTRPTNYHLTPELQTDMQGIQRQIQNEANAHVALQIHLEREQEYWSGAKGRFEPQPEATAADISLDLIGTKALYRAVYRPLVSRWIQGPAPYFVENTRIDASDGNQTVTILSDPKLNRIGQTKWRSNGDIGLLAGFGYRADAQSGSAIDGVEGKGLMPFNGSRYGIEKTILNGVSVIRLQDIITLGGAQRRTWWFDPQRDYALIQYELADFNNGLSQPSYSEMTTVQGLQKVADGVWYPTKFTTQSLRSVNGQLTDDSYRSTTTITSLATLPSIDPATFQVTSAAVNLPEQIPSTPTAQEIYDAMFQRYAKCSTFSCTGNYDQHSDGLFGITDHRMFSIRYARPSKIRIEWTQPSSWWSNSDTSTIYTESGKIFSKFDFQPTVESEKSIGDATSEAAGVSGTISYLLPSLLMGKSGYLDHWTLKRRVDEEVAGDDCYVIEVETKGFGYYIFDVRKNDNAILRAIDIVETNAAETQRTQAHKNNSAWLNGSDPTKSMIWFTRTTEFHDIAFNQPLKDETFLHNATSMSNAQPPPQTAGTMPLTQISRPQGKVINPNGEAGANAKVSLVSAGRVMTITDGRIDSEIESIFSASDGGFTLNQQAGVGDLLVVIDEEGYAAIPWEKFSGTITLIPWAKVSGTAFLGTAPAAQKAIALLMLIPPPPRSQTEGQVRFLSWATVDSQGAFAADHVPVGIIDTMLSDTPTLDQHSLIEKTYIETRAGQATQMGFGGQGVTVAGKAEMPSDPDLDLDWGQPFWLKTPVGLNTPAGIPQEQVDKLFREYYASDAGKKALLATRTKYFHIQPDGSFKIENVLPGFYELVIQFMHKPGQGGRTWAVGNTSAQVEVKAGVSSVDVPLLKLHLGPEPPDATISIDPRNPSLPASLQMEGQKLTSDQIAALERKLASDPSDLPDRVRILGYYFIKRIAQSEAQNAAQPHILWIIHNLPASGIAGDPIVSVDYRTDLPHYEEASEAWREALSKYPNDPKVIGNAAAFYLLNEPARAEKLLLQGQKLEPKNPNWDMRLGQLYNLRSMGPDTSVKATSKAEALKWFEQGLSSLKGIDRFYALEAPAKAAFEAGDLATARQYAQELLQMAPQYPKDWNYGNAIYTGNSILGQIALAQGDLPSAKNYLEAAGDSPGSPTLNSFGPDLTLARGLLSKGEKDATIAFLGKIAKFWTGQQAKLQGWQAAIQQGQTTF